MHWTEIDFWMQFQILGNVQYWPPCSVSGLVMSSHAYLCQENIFSPTSFFLIFSSSSLTVGRGTKIYLKMHNGLLIKTTVQQLKGLIRLVFTKQCQGKILVTTLAKSSRAASPCSGSASAADSTFSFTPTSGDNLIKLSTCCGPPTNAEMQGRSDSSSVSASLPLAGQVPATSPHSV